uniref:Fibronectin type-III domain-containing protein n=1 Tax=Globodera rostochiensis TaxID=31243 RepID=A0A914I7G9_GLORO
MCKRWVNCCIILLPSSDACRLLLHLLLAVALAFGNAKVPPPTVPSSSLLCRSSLLINISRSVLNISAGGHRAIVTVPLYLILEYWPPQGQPASPFTLHGPPRAGDANFTIQINGTWPAVRYQYQLNAVFGTGQRNGTTADTVLLHKGIAYSSPDKPVLVSAAATERACTLAWAPPPALHLPKAQQHASDEQLQQSVYNYYMEYFPVASSDVVFFIRTKENSVRLRKLRASTQLSLYAEYFGVRSLCPLELAFRTRRTVPRYGNRTKALLTASATTPRSVVSQTSTLPPSTGTVLQTASTVPTRIGTVMSRLPSPKTNPSSSSTTSTTPFYKLNSTVPTRIGTVMSRLPSPKTNPSSSSTTSTTPSYKLDSTVPTRISTVMSRLPSPRTNPSSSNTTSTIPPAQESVELKEISAEKSEENETAAENETEEDSSEAERGDGEEADHEMSPKQLNETEPSIRIRQHGTRTLALAWRVPELVACDAFLVRHRPLGSMNARVSTQRTTTLQALVPLVVNACLEVNVSCLFENTVSPQWSARRVLDLRTPAPVQSVRVIRSYTDEYFQASVLIGFTLPPKAGPAHFQLYEVHVAWAPGKKVVGNQRVVFRGENISATDGVGKRAEGHVNITGLEPARLYTFAVRNVSREMPSQCSAPLGVRLITPPVVTSTVYAGKISTNSINVNFGESDESHPFEQYELHFASAGDDDAAPMSGGGDKFKNGSTTLIRRLAKNDPKSFTFNKLVPGKTYTFSLFTLLHGVRSRPVDANITTYPLKVSGFHPLIGSGYVRLFWTVLNEAHNFCRFRLSYTASAGPHLHSALSLELNGTINTHRFSGLDWNTFYTFTITVIMGPPSAEAESESEAVTIGMANRPRSSPQLKRYGSRELLLSFENDPEAFPERNGAIKEFAVIVAERVALERAIVATTESYKKDNEEEAQNLLETLGDLWELPSWHDARERADDAGDDKPWIAYRTSPSNYNPFARRGSSRLAQFIIGAEDCMPGRHRLDEMYCNGALRANADYFVRVRAYSVEGIAMETAWVGIDGAVPHAVSGKQSPEQKRLPCYMYLNGCNGRERAVGSNAAARICPFTRRLVTFSTAISTIIMIDH